MDKTLMILRTLDISSISPKKYFFFQCKTSQQFFFSNCKSNVLFSYYMPRSQILGKVEEGHENSLKLSKDIHKTSLKSTFNSDYKFFEINSFGQKKLYYFILQDMRIEIRCILQRIFASWHHAFLTEFSYITKPSF